MGRILAVLEELSVAATPLANHELAARLGVPAASMYRLLRKLRALGYVDRSGEQATYSVGPRLAELGERLADAGGRSPALRRLMHSLHAETGHYVTVWVPSGVHVRIAAILVGNVTDNLPNLPGDIAPPLSTPGLAIASQWRREHVTAMITQCRRRRIALGRRFADRTAIDKALRAIRSRGFIAGYNLRADGWGMLAFPITITTEPARLGALVIGAHVSKLRDQEDQVVPIARKAIAQYAKELERERAEESGSTWSVTTRP